MVGPRRVHPSDTSDLPREGRFVLRYVLLYSPLPVRTECTLSSYPLEIEHFLHGYCTITTGLLHTDCRWWNAYSSSALTAAGCYELALTMYTTTRAPLASMLAGSVLLALGVASYGWWSSERETPCRVDNFLMEVYFVALDVLFVATVSPASELLICGLGSLSMTCRWIYMQRATMLVPAALVETFLVAYVAGVWAVLQLQSTGDSWWAVAGVSCILFGIVPKFCDIKGELVCGTAVFHLIEAFGFAAMSIWAQTLPVAVME